MGNDDPIAYSPLAAAQKLGVGRTRLFEAIKAGELHAKKFGRKTLILDSDLRRYASNLPSAVNALRRGAERR
ncbi:helix-turn-helix domain-containing protein [Methylocystis sp. L43]|uniref:helix-turn-helix domain-containing protein n=1 Tax=unclassified Methylocystis TaxID=2625913 RepID=UPI0018C2AB09|nr:MULTISPECIES: helix-turn-helix domain-containing protein [unclassified Methylocystis]MBG0796656.1 helix-turn-helix domain-containing protein [Methylocystis sp. L43]MBG0804625.1 helix-turn-helix domain-containing protein [Methylocystis sp. H15]